MNKDYLLLPLFEQFIRDSRKGRRLKANGQKIKKQTIDNYEYVFKLLTEFSITGNFDLRVRVVSKLNKRELVAEKNYWSRFYQSFSSFLYKEKGCYDNYAGSVIKVVRTFFSYLNKDKLITTGDFYKSFHKKEEDIEIITFLPEQLQFLIHDKVFEASLSSQLRYIKNITVVGCTVALRFSDLINIRVRDIQLANGHYYLAVRSVKTDSSTRVKLPLYATEILLQLGKGKGASARVFRPVSMNSFNTNLRLLAEKAGWVQETGKRRSRNGQYSEIYKDHHKAAYRFCDLVSSHIMRRTAITTMLMLGMPENLVRKISGHSPNSKAFYRYVNFVQSYLDQEIDKVHTRLYESVTATA